MHTQLPAPPILPSSSSSKLGHSLVENPLPESQPIDHGAIALTTLYPPSLSVPTHELSETPVGLNRLNVIKTEFTSANNGQSFSPITSLSTLPLSPRPKEGQDQVHDLPTAGVPHGCLHHRQHTHDSFHLVPDPTAYAYTSPPISKVCSLPFFDKGPTSSSQSPTPESLAPNPRPVKVVDIAVDKAGAHRKPAVPCFFCRERKIACGAPPVGSTDLTCDQCARRLLKCEYPKYSQRGVYKRGDNGGSHLKRSKDGDYMPNP